MWRLQAGVFKSILSLQGIKGQKLSMKTFRIPGNSHAFSGHIVPKLYHRQYQPPFIGDIERFLDTLLL